MTESRSIQDVIGASLQAEEAGVDVDWKATCLKVVQAAVAEIARLTAESEANPAPE